MTNSIEKVRRSARVNEMLGDDEAQKKLIDFVFKLALYDFITHQERMELVNEICEMRVRMRARKK